MLSSFILVNVNPLCRVKPGQDTKNGQLLYNYNKFLRKISKILVNNITSEFFESDFIFLPLLMFRIFYYCFFSISSSSGFLFYFDSKFFVCFLAYFSVP